MEKKILLIIFLPSAFAIIAHITNSDLWDLVIGVFLLSIVSLREKHVNPLPLANENEFQKNDARELLRKSMADKNNYISWNYWRETNTEILIDLKNVNFCNEDLSNINFSKVDLSNANFYCANLNKATMCGAALQNANFTKANLSEVNLSEANLSEADLSNANLYRANLYRANLRGANLSGAILVGANLSEAVLDEANLTDIIK